jgi:hypothetical protein
MEQCVCYKVSCDRCRPVTKPSPIGTSSHLPKSLSIEVEILSWVSVEILSVAVQQFVTLSVVDSDFGNDLMYLSVMAL